MQNSLNGPMGYLNGSWVRLYLFYGVLYGFSLGYFGVPVISLQIAEIPNLKNKGTSQGGFSPFPAGGVPGSGKGAGGIRLFERAW